MRAPAGQPEGRHDEKVSGASACGGSDHAHGRRRGLAMSNVEITSANSGSWGRRPAYLLSGYNVQRGRRTDSTLQSQLGDYP